MLKLKRGGVFIHTILLLLAFAAQTPDIMAQARLSGTVRDTQGEPLAGVSVIIRGTTTGTVTDAQGNYELSAEQGQTIVYSFIGFQTQEHAWRGAPINVTLLDDAHDLDEVVVTGYGGQQRRGTLTTAISKMDDAVLDNAAMDNVGKALQGTVTGLRVVNSTGWPGSTPNIVLRGGASISSSPGGALVIVDGIVRNSLSDVNPQDIESIQVLKDAASTAIYGARANGGVILIETKKGSEGRARIDYNFKIGVNKARYGYDFLNARDYLYYNRLGMRRINEAASGHVANLYNVDAQMGYGTRNGYGTSAPYFDIAYLSDATRHLLNEGWQQMDDPYYDGTEFVGGRRETLLFRDHSGKLDKDVFDDNAMTHEHYLSFSGGNDRSAFQASTGYYKEEGMVIGTSYKRFTGNLSGSYRVLPFLRVRGAAQLHWSSQPGLWVSTANLFYRTRSARPTWNPYNEDGTPSAGFGTSDGNPAYWRTKYHDDNVTTKTTFSTGLTADLLKEQRLVLDANASYLLWENQADTAWDAYQQQNQTNQNTRRNMSADITKYRQFQTNATLTWKDKFADAHDVDIMVGGEYYTYDYYSIYMEGHSAPTDDIHTMDATAEITASSTGTTKTAYRILSAFGRAQYNYDLRYLLSFTARHDGISRLADNRWGFFPGVSAGWNVGQEEFWQNSAAASVVSTLKPRVSYGVNGNVSGLGDYEVWGNYGTTTAYGGVSGIVNTSLVNKGLRWEQSQTLEVGLDIGFLDNRVSLILDYYSRQTKDLLTSLTLPNYTGFSSIRTNLGTLRNRGFEAEVRANILNIGGFTWDMTANVTTVSNKILKLPANENENNRQGGHQVAAGRVNADGTYNLKWVGGYQEGGSLDDIIAYRQDHIFRDWADVERNANTRRDEVNLLYGPGLANEVNPSTGQPYATSAGWKPIEPGDVCWEDIDGDGKITTYDRKVIGHWLPTVTGGFSSTWAWRGLRFYARFDYALGHLLYNDLMARSLGQYQGSFNIISTVKDTWSETNRDADLPKFYYADQLAKNNMSLSNRAGYGTHSNNSRLYEKGNYMACREMTLSYSLPRHIISAARLRDAQVSLTGQNLFYVTNYTGVSPEPVTSDGIDRARYPTPRTFLFGLTLSFEN